MDISLNGMESLVLALVLLSFGIIIRYKIDLLNRLCIPAPVIGGFFFALLAYLLKLTDIGTIKLDTSVQLPSMLLFFATVGIGGSFKLIKTGGKLLIIYLALGWVMVAMQLSIGISMAQFLGLDAILGIMAGPVSLAGGHGGAAAFGGTAETMGHQGALVVALAVATFGLIGGSFLGGPLAKTLIANHNVKVESLDSDDDIVYAQEIKAAPDVISTPRSNTEHIKTESKSDINFEFLLQMMALLFVAVILGQSLVAFIKSTFAFSLPSYIGAMIVTLIGRNINDVFHIIKLRKKEIEIISDVSLGVFLTMAMMSLKLWEIESLALPLMIILVVQLASMCLFVYFIVFRALGKTYDAAVMCAGMMGHGLGATPNAMANMESVCNKYGCISKKSFLIAPLCGAVLIDTLGLPMIAWAMGYFG